MQANSSLLNVPGKKDPIQVVDIPGHPRLRDQFRESLPSTKAIAFVVDANTVSRNAAIVAEYVLIFLPEHHLNSHYRHLHSVLDAIMALPPSQKLPSLLILAHKSDLIKTSSISTDATALAVNRVQTILERELERRRASQSGGMGVEGLGEEGNESSHMGGLDCSGPGGTFKFENWEGGEILFLGTCVQYSESTDEKSVKGSITPLMEWMEENM